MNFLSKYQNFIFESLVKKEMRLYYSEKFRDLLEKLSSKNEWATFLLEAEDSNQVSDIYTLIDITDKNDTISFIQVNRILRALPDIKVETKYGDKDNVYSLSGRISKDKESQFWKSGRTNITIGRWLRRVVVELHNKTIKDSDIEKFVNQYKATYDSGFNRFEIVKGDEIKKWYHYASYTSLEGQLGNSCMRYTKCQEYFEIYTKNPEVCSLLILKSVENPNKIDGRALLWILNDGSLYQDRVYTITDSDKELFNEWAEKNGYKTYVGVYNTIEVQLGNHEYKKYPYMDTFVSYSPSEKILSSDESLWPDSKYYHLQDTNGQFTDFNVIYSVWSDEYINKDRAVYCKNVESWLHSDEARYLEYKNEWAAPDSSICYSQYHEEYFYIDDCDYSESMRDYLFSEDENYIEFIVNSHGDIDCCVKSRIDLYIKVGDEYYSRKSSVKDPYTGEYKFKEKEYEKEFEEKIMNELGIERNDTTLDRNGSPVLKVLDDVRERLKTKLLSLKLTDDIKNEINENLIYKKEVKSYWLSKENLPDEEDMFALLKSFMSVKNYSSYRKELMNSFIFYRGEEMNKYEKKFEQFHLSGVLTKMLKFCESFDFSKLPDDIYKMYLFITF